MPFNPGFGQSGSDFEIKTKKVTDHLISSITPTLQSQYVGEFDFRYLDGPLLLKTPDFPPDSTSDSQTSANTRESHSGFNTDAPPSSTFAESPPRAWWGAKDNVSEYAELPSTLVYIFNYIKKHGPFDGIIGFSQGAALSLMLASWFEATTRLERRQALNSQGSPLKLEPPQGPVKFVLCVSGFRANPEYYGGFYSPKIETPVLYVIADLDIVVPEEGGKQLIGALENFHFINHPGAHFVPTEKRSCEAMTRFIERQLLVSSGYLVTEFDNDGELEDSEGSIGSGSISPSGSTSSSKSAGGHVTFARMRSTRRMVYRVRN
jgi:hypothetical protein